MTILQIFDSPILDDVLLYQELCKYGTGFPIKGNRPPQKRVLLKIYYLLFQPKHICMGTLGTSEDPDEMLLFINFCIVCRYIYTIFRDLKISHLGNYSL